MLLASATAFAGCGASKASTSSPATTAVSPTTGGNPVAATPTTAAPTTAVSGASPPSVGTTVAAGAGKGSDPGSTFCRSAVALQAQEEKQVDILTDTPAQVKKFTEQSLARLPALEAEAPSSIRSAILIVAQEDRLLFSDLAAVGYDYEKLGTKVTTLTENPRYIRADTTISGYLSQVCGLSSS
jgi:hypothetical protein